jgi:hypothetical protein
MEHALAEPLVAIVLHQQVKEPKRGVSRPQPPLRIGLVEERQDWRRVRFYLRERAIGIWEIGV